MKKFFISILAVICLSFGAVAQDMVDMEEESSSTEYLFDAQTVIMPGQYGIRGRFFLLDNIALRVGASGGYEFHDFRVGISGITGNNPNLYGNGTAHAYNLAFELGAEMHWGFGEKFDFFVAATPIFTFSDATQTHNASNEIIEQIQGGWNPGNYFTPSGNLTARRGFGIGGILSAGADYNFNERFFVGPEVGIRFLHQYYTDIRTFRISSGGATINSLRPEQVSMGLDFYANIRMGFRFGF